MRALSVLQTRFLGVVSRAPGISSAEVMEALGRPTGSAREFAKRLLARGLLIEGTPRAITHGSAIGLYAKDYSPPKGEYLGVFGVRKGNNG